MLPDSPMRAFWIKIFNEMAVHTRKRLPSDILLAARPNENPENLKYRLGVYEPITYEPTNTCLDRIYRVIGDNKFTIICNDITKAYIEQKIFAASWNDSKNVMSLTEYLRIVAQKRVIEDPNGWIIWFPTGEGLEDSSKSIAPLPMLVYSSQYKYSDNNIFIFLSEEKSPLKGDKGEIHMDGEVYWFITPAEYWKMYQTGLKSDPKWEQEMIYEHGIGEIPIIIGGGDMNADNYYESYFAPMLAFANDAIREYSDWRSTMITTNYPIREEFVIDCEIKAPHLDPEPREGEEKYEKTREYSRKNVFNTYQRKIVPKGVEGFEAYLPAEVPGTRFIHPDTANAELSLKSWQILLEKAKQALNLENNIDQAQSGKAKELDKEDEYSLINKICDNYFDNLLLKSLRYCDALLRAGQVDYTISIIKPSSYAIKTEDDIVNELSTLKEKKAPAIFLTETTLDLAHKRFSGNPVSSKIFEVVSTYDPVFIYAPEEVNAMQLTGRITKEMAQKSTMYFPILTQIAKNNPGFVDTPIEKLEEEFNKRFLLLFPKEEKVVLTDPLGNPLP